MKEDIPVLDRLRAEVVGAIARRGESPAPGRWSARRWVIATAATAAVVAIASVAILSLSSTPQAPDHPDPRALGAPESPIGGSMGSCVEQFSVENLRKREFAFDGVIRSIAVPPGETDQPTIVTFEVTRWYKGGSSDSVEIKTYEVPGAISSASLGQEDAVQLEQGQRVLGSGEEDYLWSCGFSMLYTPNNAELFEAAFNE